MENMTEKLKTFCNKLELIYVRFKNHASKSSPNSFKKKEKKLRPCLNSAWDTGTKYIFTK